MPQAKKSARLVILAANVVLGLVPSLAFFAWIERNCALPAVITRELGMPWLDLATESLALRAAFDIGLILAFGFVHSLTAQESFQRRLALAIPALAEIGAIRSLYIVTAGLSLTGVMGLWQSTGIVLWTLPLGWTTLNLLSAVVFWILTLAAFAILSRFGALEFLGLGQIIGNDAKPGAPHATGSSRLIQTGLYRHLRHPAYALTMLAIAAAPFMTLDRALVLGSLVAYLAIGIPVEERKLVAQFGGAYLDYRRRVPAVIPIGAHALPALFDRLRAARKP